jgi:hypothetical protein
MGHRGRRAGRQLTDLGAADGAEKEHNRGAPPLGCRLSIESVLGEEILQGCSGIRSIPATPFQPVDLA